MKISTVTMKGLIYSILLLCAALSDIRRREIDNYVPVSILVLSLYGTGGSFWGAVLTALPFFIPAVVKPNSIGGGDIKLMFASGALLGIYGGILLIIISLTFASIYSLGILCKKGYKAYQTARIPLAPFLCAGGILAYLASYCV